MAPIRSRRIWRETKLRFPGIGGTLRLKQKALQLRRVLLDCVFVYAPCKNRRCMQCQFALLKWTFLSTFRQLRQELVLSLYLHRRRMDPGSTLFCFSPSLRSRNTPDRTALQLIRKVMSAVAVYTTRTALLACGMLLLIKCYLLHVC